jgi:hypothetical protein
MLKVNDRIQHLELFTQDLGDMDLQLTEQRIDELVAAFAVFGDRLTNVCLPSI